MDIKKEREAFEKECRLLCYKGNMVMSNLGSFYNNEQTNWMWQMWLSSKSKAVQEGLKLAPLKATEAMVEAACDISEADETWSFYDIYEAMVSNCEP